MDAKAQLDGFIDRFTPEVAVEARALLARLKVRLPGAAILVYDNYNALAIGFAAGEKAGGVVLSIALYPRWINLFFMRGVDLGDPHGLLKGEGSRVRHIPRATAAMLDDPRVEALIAAALEKAEPPIDPGQPHRLIIKSVVAGQRPRRPKA